jgi:Domain of unknown function (DUF1707)
MRAADVDREFVAERLRIALNEGRLSLHEYDERVRDAYGAKTYGDLKALLTDLPDAAPAARSQLTPVTGPALAKPPPVPQGGHTSRWIAGIWSGWITLAGILTVIWFLTGPHGSFWPAWPLGIWGAVLLAHTVSGLASGEPEKQARRRAERETRQDAKREARRATRDARDNRGTTPQ